MFIILLQNSCSLHLLTAFVNKSCSQLLFTIYLQHWYSQLTFVKRFSQFLFTSQEPLAATKRWGELTRWPGKSPGDNMVNPGVTSVVTPWSTHVGDHVVAPVEFCRVAKWLFCPVSKFSSEKCPNHVVGEFCRNMSYQIEHTLVFYSF